MTTRFSFLSLFIFVLSICGCQDKNEVSDVVSDSSNFTIEYSRWNLLFDYNYEATINQKGILKIKEKDGLNGAKRKSKHQLSESNLFVLKQKLAEVQKINLSPKYGFDNDLAPTDLPTTSIYYYTNDTSDSTSLYYPADNELPVELDIFLNEIENVIMEFDASN